jgi:two-component system osmolarity sensor histidine kinase EnvZ
MTIEIPERRLSSPTAPVFLLWMMGSSAVFFAIAVVFLKNQIKPIRRLSVAAESFGKGQEVEGFKPEGALEVRRAAQAFIVMRERIKRQIRQRTEMLAGVSHDLRTPLTRMKLQLALMKPQEGLDELVADVADMELMVEGFLAFARGADGETSEQTDLTDLLEGVVHDARRASGRDIALDLPPACPLVLRPHAMRRCFSNLVSNALRHAKCVRVSVEEAGTAVFVNIEDDGPGIPENRRAEALRPFVRLEDSRNPDTGGVGLGLTIASDIARSHGGDLSLGISSALGGLKVMVRLPH